MFELIGKEEIDLRLTLIDSAQCFLWREEDGIFFGPHGRKLKQTDSGIYGDGNGLREYLDLDRDYASLLKDAEPYPILTKAMRALPGMRVLRQPSWETLIEFILSANNNVPRIRSLVDRMSDEGGNLPSPEELAGMPEKALRAIGVGYRAPYLIGTAKAVANGFNLDVLSSMPYEAAHKALTALPGVGDKVADCVLLFGCGHTEAFPVDVWIERAMRVWFGWEAKNRKQLATLCRERLGNHAGLLQQYLFHAARLGMIELKNGSCG